MELTFKNGSTIEIDSFFADSKQINGAYRNCLTISITNTDKTFNDIKNIFSNEKNISEIKIKSEKNDESGNKIESEDTYFDYSILYSINDISIINNPNATSYTISIGQLTELEKINKKQIELLEANRAGLIELSNLV